MMSIEKPEQGMMAVPIIRILLYMWMTFYIVI